ncbi:MAG TPA: maltotransferase domain-containing protein, partial [Gemmatimonadales bacterium]
MEPGRAVERDPDRTLPHLVVSNIAPAVVGGRYAVKRQVGDGLRVGADIFTDGHDLLAARVLYLTPGERRPSSVPMAYSFDDDRWYATLTLDRVGEWRFWVEGWIDRFATWRSELEKKVGAGQDVASELLEGADQVREAEPHARGEDHHRLAEFASLLADTNAERGARVGAALAPELQALMAAYGQPHGVTRSDRDYRVRADRREAGFAAWYEFFPRS